MAQINHTVYPKLWMLYWGNLEGGFHFYGPFNSANEAYEWGRLHLHVGTISHSVVMSDVRIEK